MSSMSVNNNSESILFQISSSDANTFLHGTNNGQPFASKLLSINKIQFQVYIYPNGIDKKQIGNIQFIVVPNKFDTSIKSVAVCCQLCCPTLQIMFKQLKVLQKTSDTIDWYPHQFQISDYENIMKNGIIFICDIEVLKIKYKSNSSTMGGIGRKLSLHKRKHSRANSLSTDMNLYVFQPQTFQAKSQINIEWIIKNKITHHIYSQNINSMWCLSLCPKTSGIKNKNNSNVELVLKLLRLPHPDIRFIEVDFTVQINELFHVHRRNISFSYNKSTETSKLFLIYKLDEFSTFKLKMNIKIIKIFKDIGKNGKEIKDSWNIFGFVRDEFQPETFQCNTDYGQHNKTNEDEKDDMKSFYSSTGSIDDITENISISTSKTAHNKSQNIKKHIQKEIKDPQRKTSYSSMTLAPPTSTNTSYRSSITSYNSSHRASILHNIAENKEDHTHQLTVDHVPWDMHIEGNNNENKQQYGHETKMDGNMFNRKFECWLCDDLQLKEYLQNFISNGCADIRCIEDFDDKTLIDYGIINKHHRKLISKEAQKFIKGENDLQELMKKNQTLKSHKKTLQENGIFTLDELQSIQTEKELLKIVSTTNVCAEIWRIIKMAPLQLEISQLQEECQLIKQHNATFFGDAMKMYKQLEENNQYMQMQVQVASILDEYFSEFKNQKTSWDQSTPNPNINTRVSGRSISSYSGLSTKIRTGNNGDSIVPHSSHSTSGNSSSGPSDDTEFNRYSHGDSSNTSAIIFPKIKSNPWMERDNKQ
eukprot:46815_1